MKKATEKEEHRTPNQEKAGVTLGNGWWVDRVLVGEGNRDYKR